MVKALKGEVDMRWFVGFLITSVISLNVVLLLSYLPLLNDKKEVKPVYNNVIQQKILDDDNIVDHFIALPIHLEIIKVDWKHSILAVDLNMTTSNVNLNYIYNDLTEITHFALSSMNNVKQVLVRVFHNKTSEPSYAHFVIAMNAEREQWSVDLYQQVKENKVSKEEFLKAFSLTYSKKWNKWTDDTE